MVLNSQKYRALVTRAVAQEKNRERVERFRLKHKEACNGAVMVPNGSVIQSEADTATETSQSCAEPSPAPAQEDPAVCVFQTNGKVKSWILRESKLAEYKPLYPGIDVRMEAMKARQWCIDNPAKRKTASGMTRFLNSWLDKAQNSTGRGSLFNSPQPVSQPARINIIQIPNASSNSQ